MSRKSKKTLEYKQIPTIKEKEKYGIIRVLFLLFMNVLKSYLFEKTMPETKKKNGTLKEDSHLPI